MTNKTQTLVALDPEPSPTKEEITLPSSKKQITQLFQSLTLFQKLEAYTNRLKKAQKLAGELKLQVLRNILRRLVRFQQEVDTDLEQKITFLQQTYNFYTAQAKNDPENNEIQEMPGYIALYLAKLDGIRTTWEDIITQQHEENLLRLEHLLPERNEDQ